MALKVELKPHEKILIGECVITNGDQRTRFIVDGSAPILREKDIMTAEQADTVFRAGCGLAQGHLFGAASGLTDIAMSSTVR